MTLSLWIFSHYFFLVPHCGCSRVFRFLQDITWFSGFYWVLLDFTGL